MEPSTEDLRSQVLQNTLQQISSPTSSATTCCVICLGDLVEQCEAQPCRHNNFDYICLITWLEQRATCPLCKSVVREVRYEVNHDGKQEKVYKVPQRSEASDKSNSQEWDALASSYSSHSEHAEPYENEAIRRRRFVYQHNLYSLHVGSNKRQKAALKSRELSPELFTKDPALISRARKWLRRELQVFRFLYDNSNSPYDYDPVRRPKASRVEYLIEYVVAILKVVDIQGSAGHAENLIQEYLGRKYTRLFLHELRAWLGSPCDSLNAWDCFVQYNCGPLP